MSHVRHAALAVFALLFGGLADSPARAQGAFLTPLTGRWVAQIPGATFGFDYGPGLAATQDGGLVGRFSHGEVYAGGLPPNASQGEYIFRPLGPGLALVVLKFDNGMVVTVVDHPLNGAAMEVFRNGQIEIYIRQ